MAKAYKIAWGAAVASGLLAGCGIASLCDEGRALMAFISLAAWAVSLGAAVLGTRLDRAQRINLAAGAFLGAYITNRVAAIASMVGALSVPSRVPTVLATSALALAGAAFALLWAVPEPDAEPEASEPALPAKTPKWQTALSSLEGYELLSERERLVLQYSIQGMTIAESAAVLGVAPSTVSSQRVRAYEKLGVRSLQDILVGVRDSVTDGAVAISIDDNNPEVGIKKAGLVTFGITLAIVILLGMLRSFLIATAYYVLLTSMTSILFIITAFYAVFKGRSKNSVPIVDFATVACTGACCGLSAGTVARCAFSVLLPVCIVASLMAAIPMLWLGTLSFKSNETKGLRCQTSLLVASLMFSDTGRSEVVFSEPIAVLSFAALLFVVAVSLWEHKREVAAFEALDVIVTGDARLTSYFAGRGLSSTQARAGVLLAYGYDARSLAEALSVATSTAKNYRAQVYRALDVHSHKEFISLLVLEAGFGLADGMER